MGAPTATRGTERTAETNSEKRNSRHYEESPQEGNMHGRKVKHEKKTTARREKHSAERTPERVYSRAESKEKISSKGIRSPSKESPTNSEASPETRRLKDRNLEPVTKEKPVEPVALEIPDNSSSSETQTLTEGPQSSTPKEKMRLPNHSLGKAEQSDLDGVKAKARLAFMEKCQDYNELAMKTLRTEEEDAKMTTLVKDIPKSLELLEKLRSLEQHADETFNFFPSEDKDAYKKLNKYLNDNLVLRLGVGRRQMKGSVEKIANLIARDKDDKKRIQEIFHRNDIDSLRLQCKYIKSFMNAIQSIGSQIRDPKPDHAEKTFRKLPQNLQAIVTEIKKNIPGATQDFKNKLAEAINVTYVQGRLENFWLTTSRKVIEVFQRDYPDDPVMYSEVKEKWYTAFWKAIIKEPMTNFLRVILGGYLYWKRANGESLLEAFVNRGEELREKDFNKYVEDSQHVFAKEIFNEEFEVVRDLSQYMFEEAGKNMPPEDANDLLKVQEYIMLFIQSLPPGSNEKKLFIAKLEAKLNGRNKSSVEKMVELLMLFYRIPSQTFLWQATMIVKTAFKALYPLDDDHIKTINDNDDQTKVVEISVDNSLFSVNYGRLAKITGKNLDDPDACYLFSQKFTVNILKPNAPKEITLTDPLTVEFYCKRPEGLSDHDRKELDYNKKRIDSVLAVLGIPPILMID